MTAANALTARAPGKRVLRNFIPQTYKVSSPPGEEGNKVKLLSPRPPCGLIKNLTVKLEKQLEKTGLILKRNGTENSEDRESFAGGLLAKAGLVNKAEIKAEITLEPPKQKKEKTGFVEKILTKAGLVQNNVQLPPKEFSSGVEPSNNRAVKQDQAGPIKKWLINNRFINEDFQDPEKYNIGERLSKADFQPKEKKIFS